MSDRSGEPQAGSARAGEHVDEVARAAVAGRTRRLAVLSAVYYSGLIVLLGMAVTGTLGSVFPAELAEDIGEESEALVLAVALPAWIQFARPLLIRTRYGWPATLLAAVAFLATGVCMYFSALGLPTEVSTLSEPVLALAALVPYSQLRRPLRRRTVAALPTAAVLLVLLAPDLGLVVKAPELLAMLVLVPVGLDVVDRRILEPDAVSTRALRWSWYALLLLAPLCLALLFRDAFAGTPRRNVVQVQEAWLGVLLLQLYLAARLALGSRDPVDVSRLGPSPGSGGRPRRAGRRGAG
jgi:hypothetical protein